MKNTLLFVALLFALHAGAQKNLNGLMMKGGLPGHYYPTKDTTGLYYLSYFDNNEVEHRITKSIFEEMDMLINGRFLVKQNGKYGYINKAGNIAIPCIYDNATRFSNAMAVVLYNCQTGIIDTTGKLTLLNKDYSYVLPFEYNRAVVVYNNRYGVINKQGIEVVPPNYQSIWGYEHNMAIVKDTVTNKLGVIDTNGTEVFKPVFDYISYFKSTGFAEIGKWGLKNNVNYTYKGIIYKDGTVILPPVFDILKISDNYSHVTFLTEKNHYKKKFFHINFPGDEGSNSTYKIVDTAAVYSATGKLIFGIQNAEIVDIRFSNYYCLANDTLYVINENGVAKIPGVKSANSFFFNHSTYLTYSTGKNKIGVCNTKGQMLCAPIYSKIFPSYASPELMAVRKGAIDILNIDFQLIKSIPGNTISDALGFSSKWRNDYTHIHTFRQNKKYGILDSAYNVVVPAQYSSLQVKNSIIIYKQNNKYGALDKNFQPLLPAQYSHIYCQTQMHGEYMIVAIGKKRGVANMQGNVVIPPIYKSLNDINYVVKDTLINGKSFGHYKTAFIVKKHTKKGLIGIDGTTILPFAYDAIKWCEWNYFIVKQHNKMAVVNLQGKTVIPFVYQTIDFTGISQFEVSNGKHQCGVVNLNNKIIIPLQYDRVQMNTYLAHPYYRVETKGKWGLYDTLGNMLYKPEYDRAEMISRYDENFILVNSSKVGLGDKNGRILLPVEYDAIEEWVEDLYVIRLGTGPTATYGIANTNGKIIVDPYYKATQITYYRNTVIVLADGKQYFYNSQGQPVNDCYIDKHTDYNDIKYISAE